MYTRCQTTGTMLRPKHRNLQAYALVERHFSIYDHYGLGFIPFGDAGTAARASGSGFGYLGKQGRQSDSNCFKALTALLAISFSSYQLAIAKNALDQMRTLRTRRP